MPASKRRKIGKKHGYKSGNTVRTGKSSRKPASKPIKQYARLSVESFDARVNENAKQLTFRDVDGKATKTVPLRPLNKRSKLIDRYATSNQTFHPDLYTMKLYRPFNVQSMFNSEIKNHRNRNPHCNGDLVFDGEYSRRWGLGWSERLKCTICKYISPYHKLYEEVPSKTRGRRAAKVNLGLQLGLQTSSISNTAARRILAHSEIIPPCASGLQDTANKLNDGIVRLNKRDMHKIRQNLAEENEMCGHKDKKQVKIEGDSCYNNPIFNSESTPFQAGTIVTTTMCENNTKEKLVIGAHVGSKLCKVASLLLNRGQTVECPNHKGKCTANVSQTEPIGNEKKWNEIVANEIGRDLEISCYTGDGDSKGHAGVDLSRKKSIIHLKDTRHLANSMKRELYKAPFSKGMLSAPGLTKSNQKNRFALSVRARCIAELNAAHKKYDSNIEQIKEAMASIIPTIVMCFKGYCGSSCEQRSLVCSGNYRKAKCYLPPNAKVHMNEKDEVILKKCIEILLGRNSLEKTKFQTSTQKCESVNRAYQACLPKAVTFSRNSAGRVHAQILKLNHGYADSTVLKSSKMAAKLEKGTSVIKHLNAVDKINKRNRTLKSKQRSKLARHNLRLRKYNLHAKLHYSKGMTDPKLNLQSLKQLADHSYA
jgi:hypothetical protein